MNEIWKDVVGYEGKYMVSSLGRIKSSLQTKPKILSKHVKALGYESIKLYRNGSCKTKAVHRLVAKAFVENPENKKEVNHINGIKDDNRPENLEWCTRSENMKHACRTGLILRGGDNSPRAKLTESDAMEIRFHLSIGEKRKTLSKDFNISLSTIDNIASNNTWKNINIHNYLK